jgi:hypothetical protein
MRALLLGILVGTILWLAGRTAHAESLQPPLLGRVIGGVGENGETQLAASKRCFIYPNQILIQSYDPISKKSDQFTQPLNLTSTYVRQVVATLEKVSKARETAATNRREVLPHLYYFGYVPMGDGTTSPRVRLFHDGVRRIERQGAEMPSLLQIIEHLCPHR